MKFTIILKPKGQMRARGRAFIAGGRAIAGKPRKDEKQVVEENKLLTLLYTHRPPQPLEGPLMLGVKVFLPMAASKMKGRKGEKWKSDALSGLIRPTTKPDLDNCIKHLKDVVKGVFWQDDKQVVEYLPGTGKWFGDPARWEIEILTLEEYWANRGNIIVTIDQIVPTVYARELF